MENIVHFAFEISYTPSKEEWNAMTHTSKAVTLGKNDSIQRQSSWVQDRCSTNREDKISGEYLNQLIYLGKVGKEI